MSLNFSFQIWTGGAYTDSVCLRQLLKNDGHLSGASDISDCQGQFGCLAGPRSLSLSQLERMAFPNSGGLFFSYNDSNRWRTSKKDCREDGTWSCIQKSLVTSKRPHGYIRILMQELAGVFFSPDGIPRVTRGILLLNLRCCLSPKLKDLWKHQPLLITVSLVLELFICVLSYPLDQSFSVLTLLTF